MLQLDLQRPDQDPAVFRIPEPESRIRHISTRGVVTSLKDPDNVIHLRWHPFPAPGCGGPGS